MKTTKRKHIIVEAELLDQVEQLAGELRRENKIDRLSTNAAICYLLWSHPRVVALRKGSGVNGERRAREERKRK